jgi:hypothetical protein
MILIVSCSGEMDTTPDAGTLTEEQQCTVGCKKRTPRFEEDDVKLLICACSNKTVELDLDIPKCAAFCDDKGGMIFHSKLNGMCACL